MAIGPFSHNSRRIVAFFALSSLYDDFLFCLDAFFISNESVIVF